MNLDEILPSSRLNSDGKYMLTVEEMNQQKAVLDRGLETVSHIKKLLSSGVRNPNISPPETELSSETKELAHCLDEIKILKSKLEKRDALIIDLRREATL